MRSHDRWLVTVLLLVTSAYALAEDLTLTTSRPCPCQASNSMVSFR